MLHESVMDPDDFCSPILSLASIGLLYPETIAT